MKMKIHGIGTQTNPHINAIYVCLSLDGATGNEGVVAGFVGGQWTTLVTSELRLVPALVALARGMVAGTNSKIKIAKFTTREDVETIG